MQTGSQNNQAPEIWGLFKEANDICFYADRALRITKWCNSDLYFGYSLEEWKKNGWKNHLTPESKKHITDFKQNISQQKADILETELECVHKEGHIVHIRIRFFKQIENDEILGYFGLIRDITHQKKLEKDLEQEQSKSQTILQALPDLMFIIDEQGFIRDIKSDISKRNLFYPPEKLIGKKLENTGLPKAVSLTFLKYVKECLISNELVDFEYFLEVKGEEQYFDVRMAPLNDKQVVCVERNITHREIAKKQLEVSRTHYQNLFSKAKDGIIIFRNDRLFDCNKEMCKMLRVKKAEVEDLLKKQGFFPGYTLETRVHYHFEKIYKQACRFEFSFINTSGDEVETEVSLHAFDLGEDKFIQAFVREISERKKILRELSENERKFSTLLANLPGIAYRCNNDENWTMQYLSSGCFNITGYTAEKLINNKKLSYGDVIFEDDREMVNSIVQESILKGIPFELQYRIINPEKGIRWVWEQGEAVYDDSGKLTALEGYISDITEQKINELELLQGQKNLKNVVEYSPTGIIIRNKEQVLFINQTALDVLGVEDISSLKKSNNFDFLHEDFHAIASQRLKDLEDGKDIPFMEMKIIRPSDGKILELETKSDFIEFNGEKVLHIVFRDISLQKRLMDEQIRAQVAEESYQKLKKEVNQRKKTEKQLKKSLNEKEVLFREVHHRVKNNMQIISSILSLQARKQNDSELNNIMQESQDRIKSMALVHENLYQTEDLSNVNFERYLKTLAENLWRSYKIGSGNIELSIEVDPIMLPLDYAVPCGLIINELLSNALKYAFENHDKGCIFVSMKEVSLNRYEIVVSDNGKGIGAEIDFENPKTLGLQLVSALIEQIEGKLTLHKENGTEFIIKFKV